MSTARKWVAVDFGGPEVLRNIGVDVPDPGPGQVSIDVRAAGLNPAGDNPGGSPEFPSEKHTSVNGVTGLAVGLVKGR